MRTRPKRTLVYEQKSFRSQRADRGHFSNFWPIDEPVATEPIASKMTVNRIFKGSRSSIGRNQDDLKRYTGLDGSHSPLNVCSEPDLDKSLLAPEEVDESAHAALTFETKGRGTHTGQTAWAGQCSESQIRAEAFRFVVMSRPARRAVTFLLSLKTLELTVVSGTFSAAT